MATTGRASVEAWASGVRRPTRGPVRAARTRKRPDTGTGAGCGHAVPPAARLSPRRCRASLSCAMAPSCSSGDPCPCRSGIGRYLAVLSPPQIRASGFHRTRLPGQSSYPVYLQDRVAPRWVCLQPQGPYLPSATVLLCLPASSPDPLPHVSTRAGQVSPLSAALCARLGIPVAFRLAPVASWGILSSWGIVPPVRLAYWPVGAISALSTRPQEGFHVPHRRDATGVGAL